MLPNLLIIGAGKSGTTSLQRYLAQHPEVSMSKQKELQFFTREDWRERIEWYEQRFPLDTPVRGEASPVYTMDPAFPSPAGRIRSLIPDVKLVYLVRDPIERLLAHYVEWAALGIESRSLSEVLEGDGAATSAYVCASLYSAQLERYLEHFPAEQLLVMDHHDLLVNRQGAMRMVFSFLGVDSDFVSESFHQAFNVRGEKVGVTALGAALHRRGWLRRVRRAPPALRRPLMRAITRPVVTPELDRKSRAWLRELFAGDVERLRRHTGKRFESWSV